MAKQKQESQKQFVRILGSDIDSDKTLLYGFTGIKGVSYMFSNAMCHLLKFDKNKKIKDLKDEDIQKLEKFLENPQGVPDWMCNKRKDYESGETKHLSTKDLGYDLMQLKRRLFRIKSYIGIRHKRRLPVRGQRTKSNFRPGRIKKARKN